MEQESKHESEEPQDAFSDEIAELMADDDRADSPADSAAPGDAGSDDGTVEADILIINDESTDSVVDAEMVSTTNAATIDATPVAAVPTAEISIVAAQVGVAAANTSQDASIPNIAKPPIHWQKNPQSQLARESIASVGGAVGSVVLGSLAIVGALVSPLAAINAVLGFILAVWGMSSPRKKLAGIGMGLCALGLIVPICLAALSTDSVPKPELFVNDDADVSGSNNFDI